MLWLEGLDGDERREKTALLLAHERYAAQFAPFVKGRASRLSYVRSQIDTMLSEVSVEAGADEEKVRAGFEEFLAAVLEKNRWKHEELGQEDSDTVVKFTDGEPPQPEEVGAKLEQTDVADRGEVEGLGAEFARDPDSQVTVNLTEETSEGLDPSFSKVACARCDKESTELVCEACTKDLQALAQSDFGYEGEGHSAEYNQDQFMNNTDFSEQGEDAPAVPFRCTLCGNEEASREAAIQHVEDDHSDILQRQFEYADNDADREMELDHMSSLREQAIAKTIDLLAARKLSMPPDLKTAYDEDPAKVEPLPESPADRFEEYVQDLANRAAASQFSQVGDEAYHSLASQLGLDEDEVRGSLHAVAVFGDYVGANGELIDEMYSPEGFQEVSAEGVSGRMAAREALVPTDMVISKVAEDMNMAEDLAYSYIRDTYGDDLPQTYHASVNGELHFYLPAELAVGAQQEQMRSQPPMDPNAGPSLAPQQNTPAAAQPMPAQPPRF